MKNLLLVLLAIGAVKLSIDYYPVVKAEVAIRSQVKKANSELPKVYNDVIRMEQFRYEKKTVYAVGTVLDAVPINDSYKPRFEAGVKQMYCSADWKLLQEAKISFVYTIKFESINYKGIEWEFRETPEVCQG